MQVLMLKSLILLGTAGFFIISWSSFLRHSDPSEVVEKSKISRNPIDNATLGFEKIFALALPDRADRVVPLLDAANVTNLTVTVLDAVRDAQIPEDSRPKGWGEGRETQVGELGCLTSHVRTWQKMIAERISTALVLESDADWDLRIRSIMTSVSPGVQKIVDWPFTNATEPPQFDPSPYGTNWDIIWMGHCGSSNWGYGRIYSFNDTSVPPEELEYTFASPPQDEQHHPGTRIIYELGGAVCSTAYAISHAGAVKLVEYFKEASENLDIELAQRCRSQVDMACVGIWPQVITSAPTLSNIEHPDGETAGYSGQTGIQPGPGLQYSARVNAQTIMQGAGPEAWHPEWESTWMMVRNEWTLVSFQEAKELEEVEGSEKTKGTTSRWQSAD